MHGYVEEKKFAVNITQFHDNGWTLTHETKLNLLQKVITLGKPLREFVNGKIYRGILTGLNEAFVIDEATKNLLIAKDINSAEIIKPFLIGRDIKKYQQPVSDKYIIFTRRGTTIDLYPAIREYLSFYRDKLEPKPQSFNGKWLGRKEGSYKWYEIQDSTEYCSEFENTKIIWPGITSEITSFAFDQLKYYGNDNTHLIISDDLALLGILNSKVSKFYLTNLCDFVRGGFIRLKISYVEQLPIYVGKPLLRESIKNLVSLILNLKKVNPKADTKDLESEIDSLVSCQLEYV